MSAYFYLHERRVMVVFVKVALAIEAKDGGMGYYYHVEDSLISELSLGKRVVVPFGQDEAIGYIIEIKASIQAEYKIKAILGFVDQETYLSDLYFNFALKVARYYFTNPYYVLELMFPKFKKMKKLVTFSLSHASAWSEYFKDNSIKVLYENLSRGALSKEEVEGYLSAKILKKFLANQLLEKHYQFLPIGRPKEKKIYRLLENDTPLSSQAKKQRRILDVFETHDCLDKKTIEDLLETTVGEALKALVVKGYLKEESVPVERIYQQKGNFGRAQGITLNHEQANAYQEVISSLDKGYQGFLLNGVTGSGKTEVYIALVKHILQRGEKALVLVPEIALTPQLYGRFQAVFGEKIGLWHSGLSDGERLDQWQRLQLGKTEVLLGVRSSIFVPMDNLGIIIIDEAHEASYKQSEPEPRYHTLKVAELLAKMTHIPLVLGSATPLVETTWQAREKGSYKELFLKEKALTQDSTKLILYDMRQESRHEGYFIGDLLLKKIEDRLLKKEQIILFLNRRGYATVVQCQSCGELLTCPHCSSHLTYHQGKASLSCHYCNEQFTLPKFCPNCKQATLDYKGYGTEQVEYYLKKWFPETKICRLDYDTTREKDAFSRKLSSFFTGEYSILLGTQMIAKGLDVENVTLVGVINADIGLGALDYKAREKTFSQLLQVAGRAGRGNKSGEVVIQSYQVEQGMFDYLLKGDYEGFYQEEIKERELMGYPPFTNLLRILVSDTDEAYLKNALALMKETIVNSNEVVTLMGPAPCIIEKVRGRYRYQMILKGDGKALYRLGWLLRHRYRFSKHRKNYRMSIDLAPESLL